MDEHSLKTMHVTKQLDLFSGLKFRKKVACLLAAVAVLWLMLVALHCAGFIFHGFLTFLDGCKYLSTV